MAADYFVVCPDLPGYGASDKPEAAERSAKRATAAIMVDLMRSLGHSRFAVVGHDRGALVAFRAALDHPSAVERVGMIDVIPTVDLWESLHGVVGVFAFHLYLLAQPGDIAARMIAADPDLFHGHFLDIWAPDPGTIPDDIRAAYLAADHDRADRAAGRRITVPALAIWQDPGDRQLPFDPSAIWHSWATDLRTAVLPGGHFLPEVQPGRVAAAIRELLGR